MEVVKCNEISLPLLAQLNIQFLKDENNDNIPPINVLEESLKCSIEQGSNAYLFLEDSIIAGYALVRTELSLHYLSHFFICQNMRRKHIGTIAFHQLMAKLNGKLIEVDVFSWNQRGQEFCRSLGFSERRIIMRKYK